jgi:2-polyprenyl-3-methyl-5-hydroxy-6-metoxy-1,4-benzoquinol methylase
MTDESIYKWVNQDCPVCGIPPSKFLGRRGGTAHRQQLGVECQVWQCGNCGLIFPNPMPLPVGGPEQHYAVPPEEYFRNHDPTDREAYAQLLMEHLRSMGVDKGKLLDVGAGRGELLRVARQEGWDATGIETSPTFAEYAARYSGAEVIQKSLEECAFPEGTFDAVVLGAVLEHLYNPGEVVREIARILKPGGALFIDVPNEAGLYFKLGNLYQRLRRRDWVVNLAPTFEPYHVFGFTPKSLRALLAKNGLRPKIWYVFTVSSSLPDRGGLVGRFEYLAAKAVAALSRRGELGEYIATWAVKEPQPGAPS